MTDRTILPDSEAMAKTAKHIVYTGIVGDSLGSILNGYSYNERQYIIGDWVRKNKGEYPHIRNKKRADLRHNSRILLELIELLGDTKPLISIKNFQEFKDFYWDLTNEYLADNLEHNLLMAIGPAVGIYAGLSSLRAYFDPFKIEELVSMMLEPFAESEYPQLNQNSAASKTIVYLFQRLIVDGYFGMDIIQTCLDRGMCHGPLVEILDTFNYYARCKPEYFVKRYPDDNWFTELTYYERLSAISLFYMYKIDLNLKGIKKPRFLVEDIVNIDKLGMQDLLFMFSTLCTASEHNCLLFVKPLHEQIGNKTDVENAINAIIA
jgi:hypothetical protein